jgi:hypothetical protein
MVVGVARVVEHLGEVGMSSNPSIEKKKRKRKTKIQPSNEYT